MQIIEKYERDEELKKKGREAGGTEMFGCAALWRRNSATTGRCIRSSA